MTVSIELQMEQMGQRAKKAARVLSAAAPAAKTQALRALAALLIERQPDILKANALDVDAAKAANMDAPRQMASWRKHPLPDPRPGHRHSGYLQRRRPPLLAMT